MTLPSYEEIISLHKKHAPTDGAFDLVFTHCQIIRDIAQQLIVASDVPVDQELVKVGCLLHDIGVYRLYLPDGTIDHKNYIKHGILGYDLLRDEGFDEEICRIASCHTGMGLAKQEIVDEKLPLPPADYFATTLEEKIIMYADKFHTKTTPPKLMTPDTFAQNISKFGAHKVERFRILQQEFGTPDLKLLAIKYNMEII